MIAEMKVDMSEKARDIMSRKEDTVYLGRHIFMQGEKFLKNMKSSNPADKVNKIEATRMLMKERAKTKGRALRQERSSEDCSEDTSRSVTNI